ncbi:MAG: chemotaxis protein CheW [Desulfobulbaceae bacterium]|nr:chemotaxis protein CheW [Desulfobulbaceae bacterium]
MMGFMIDSMDNVIEVDEGEVLPPPPNLDAVEEDLIKGVIKQGDELVILLDVRAVLERATNAVDAERE